MMLKMCNVVAVVGAFGEFAERLGGAGHRVFCTRFTSFFCGINPFSHFSWNFFISLDDCNVYNG